MLRQLSSSELESRMQAEVTAFAQRQHHYGAERVLFSVGKASPNRPALHPSLSQAGNQTYGTIFVVFFL